ncbi:MAG: pilin [Candidatus Parcubacteria bacterium]|jgi:hypothetical protein|nr:MAG: hypothetical protein JST_6360 [Candidatus Parcubacteria bacterium]
MKKLTKRLLSLALLLSLVVIPVATLASSGLNVGDLGVTEIDNTLELGRRSPIETVTRIINAAMIFLGIIAVGIILIAGFKWMTAGGSDDKVGEAKKLMSSGVVGLIIILAAWGIAYFILEMAVDVTQ